MKQIGKKLLAGVIAAIIMILVSVSALAFEDRQTESTISAPLGPSVNLSAKDKIAFAKEIDALCAEKVQKNDISSASRDEVSTLMLQAANATGSGKTAINEKLAGYSIYEFKGQVLNSSGIGIESQLNDVTVSAPSVYYDARERSWTVTCGGYWKTNNWEINPWTVYGNVGEPDGFGIRFTSVSGTYSSYVTGAYAQISNGEGGSDYESVTTPNRSDGNGALGFGFKLQDYVTANSVGCESYVGKYWSGYCTYSKDFQNYSCISTGYYVHTWNSSVINSITLLSLFSITLIICGIVTARRATSEKQDVSSPEEQHDRPADLRPKMLIGIVAGLEMKKTLYFILIMACIANTLAGCCKVENPSGMTPVETVQKYFYYWNAKSDSGMDSLEYKGMPKGNRKLYHVLSVELNSCTQDDKFDKSGWCEQWYNNPYDCARVYADFTIDTKNYPIETYTYSFYLVKESENADWIIAMYGQG